MGKITTDIAKSSFTKSNAHQYKLSILVGMDNFSYCIYGPSKELLVLKKIDFEEGDSLERLLETISNMFEQEALLKLPFDTVQLHWTTPFYTLIPNRLYIEADKQQYLLPLKRPLELPETYLANPISSIDSQLIYTIPQEVYQFFNQFFDKRNFTLQHHFTSLIDKLKGKAKKGKELFLNVSGYWIQLFFFDNQELIFSNQFKFESEKDFLYFVLLAYDQFKLDTKEIPLTIAGMLSDESAIYNSLYRYIQHLYFVNLPDVFQSDLDLKEYPAHFFFDILHAA